MVARKTGFFVGAIAGAGVAAAALGIAVPARGVD
jgi:hypothetical protein